MDTTEGPSKHKPGGEPQITVSSQCYCSFDNFRFVSAFCIMFIVCFVPNASILKLLTMLNLCFPLTCREYSPIAPSHIKTIVSLTSDGQQKLYKTQHIQWAIDTIKYLENKKRQFWFCCHMLSGNCQARPQRTVIYGVVIVCRNLERTNQNYGFKLTALEKTNDSLFLTLTSLVVIGNLFFYLYYVAILMPCLVLMFLRTPRLFCCRV